MLGAKFVHGRLPGGEVTSKCQLFTKFATAVKFTSIKFKLIIKEIPKGRGSFKKTKTSKGKYEPTLKIHCQKFGTRWQLRMRIIFVNGA